MIRRLRGRSRRYDCQLFFGLLPVDGICVTLASHVPEQLTVMASELVTGAVTETTVEDEETGSTETESAAEPLPVAREDSLTRFVETQCERKPGEWTPTGFLHEAYVIYCEADGLPPLSAAHFSRELGERYGLVQERRKVQGKVVRGISSIRLNGLG